MFADPPRIVFFGMDSPFSSGLLQALIHAKLKPVLVVDGVAPNKRRRSATVSHYPVTNGPVNGFLKMIRLRADHQIPQQNKHAVNLVKVAHEAGIDALVCSDPNVLRVRAKIQAIKADFFVVAVFHKILSPELIGLAKRGGLNVHPGYLPAQRGAAPLFWALKAGASRIGFAIHILEEAEDSGDIVADGEIEFTPGLHGQEILKQCAFATSPHLVRACRALWAGDLVRTKQSRIGVGRCPRPSYRDNLVDASKTAEQVYIFVCGCVGAYPIFVECGGDRFFIGSAERYSMTEELPCEFLLSGDKLLLACAPGVVELQLRPNGGAVFSAEYRHNAQDR
jgi:methionyl-tRNA formyltransferase